MDTRSGEIFPLDRKGNVSLEEYTSELEAMRAQARMLEARARSELVPVSDQVARQQRIGQRVEDRRRKRKAAKAARKKNRG